MEVERRGLQSFSSRLQIQSLPLLMKTCPVHNEG
jgi:hypothetical protein